MVTAGVDPGEECLVADASIHRFRGPGDKPGRKNCWYVLFPEGGGAFGSWRLGIEGTVASKGNGKLTAADKQRIKKAQAEAAKEREELAAVAAKRAARLWAKAVPIASSDEHPYLTSKSIKPRGCRRLRDLLVLPMKDPISGDLTSLQFIGTNHAKNSIRDGRTAGCYLPITDSAVENPTELLIAEGYATACSILEATGTPTAAAFFAGNLPAVAKALHQKYPKAKITICADDDRNTTGNPGLTKAREAARQVDGFVAIPKFVDPNTTGTDFNDLARAEGIEAVSAQIANANRPEAAAVDPVLEELAKLSPLEFSKIAKAKAKEIGVDATTLKTEVKKARAKYQTEHSEVRPAPTWAPPLQMHAEPVKGEDLIEELVEAIRSFVMLSEDDAFIVALWVLFTWVFEHVAETNPYLRVISATPECGKSTLLKVLRWLARSAWLLARLSPSSFSRAMSNERRTLLLDEGDAFLHENEIMRNLLDGASDPDTAIVSVVEKAGDNWKPIELNLFVPIAIASIGPLRKMETVESRGIATHLQRATGAELKKLEKARRLTLKVVLEPLAQKCARWAKDNADTIKNGKRPEFPDTMSGREMDKWEPLVMIACALSKEAEKLANDIALKVSGARADDGRTVGILLLVDLQGPALFENPKTTFQSTSAILEELHKLEHRPWPAFGRGQQPINSIQLARMLKPFGIYPTSDGKTRGYKRSDFEDAFMRYPACNPIQLVNPSEAERREEKFEISNPSSKESDDGYKMGETHTESEATDTLTGKNVRKEEMQNSREKTSREIF